MRDAFTHYSAPKNISPRWSQVVEGLVSVRHKKGWSQATQKNVRAAVTSHLGM